MKKTKLTIGFLATLLVITVSCKRDFLNTQPLDQISSVATWSDGALSEAFVFGVYASFGYGGFEEQARLEAFSVPCVNVLIFLPAWVNMASSV